MQIGEASYGKLGHMGYTTEQRRVYQNKRRDKIRQELKNLLGNKCVVCETADSLQFDHICPLTKNFTIASGLDRSKKDLLVEIQKCQLLCFDCHKQKTIYEATTGHPSFSRYDDGCRCDPCVKLVREYKKEWARKRKLGSEVTVRCVATVCNTVT